LVQSSYSKSDQATGNERPGFKSKNVSHDSISIENCSFSVPSDGWSFDLFKTTNINAPVEQVRGVWKKMLNLPVQFFPQTNFTDKYTEKNYALRGIHFFKNKTFQRRERSAQQATDPDKRALKHHFLSKRLQKTPVVGPALDPDFKEHDMKIHFKLGLFYLIVPRRIGISKLPTRPYPGRDLVGAIDPGVRKFATIYSPEGRTEQIGSGGSTNNVLDKHIRRIQRTKKVLKRTSVWFGSMKSQVDGNGAFLNTLKEYQVKEKRKKKLRKKNRQRGHLTWPAWEPSPPPEKEEQIANPNARKVKSKLRKKLNRAKRSYHQAELKARNVIRNLHYNTAHYLLSRYKTLILPNFNGHSCAGGKLPAQVKRRMQMLSFGQFANRLIQTSTGYQGAVIKRGSEAYTSKQCGKCGFLNDKLGGSETFTCKRCKAEGDRDEHAARNILLRFMECKECKDKTCCKVIKVL
jgi:transposase